MFTQIRVDVSGSTFIPRLRCPRYAADRLVMLIERLNICLIVTGFSQGFVTIFCHTPFFDVPIEKVTFPLPSALMIPGRFVACTDEVSCKRDDASNSFRSFASSAPLKGGRLKAFVVKDLL